MFDQSRIAANLSDLDRRLSEIKDNDVLTLKNDLGNEFKTLQGQVKETFVILDTKMNDQTEMTGNLDNRMSKLGTKVKDIENDLHKSLDDVQSFMKDAEVRVQ